MPPGDARLALHRREIRVAVLPPDRHARDEMVDHEVVQDDDARPPAQRVDDPRVRVRVVADVVERRRRRPPTGRVRPGSHDLDLDEPLERRAAAAPSSRRCRDVLGGSGEKYATFTSGDRREEPVDARVPRDGAARARARRGRARCASSVCPRSHAHARASVLDARRDDEPGLALVDDVERAAGVGRRQTGFSERNASYGTSPKSSFDGRVVDAEAARVEIGELARRRRGRRTRRGRRARGRARAARAARGPARRRRSRRAARARAPPPRSAGRSASRGRAG